MVLKLVTQLLRLLKGFETFCDALEVMEMLKGGFSFIDAPNVFTGRVDNTFTSNQCLPAHADPKIYLKHSNKQLSLKVSAHMDDFKATVRLAASFAAKRVWVRCEDGCHEDVHPHWHQPLDL